LKNLMCFAKLPLKCNFYDLCLRVRSIMICNEPGATPIRYFFFLVNATEVFFEFESKGCHMSRRLLFFLVLWGGRGAKGKGVTCSGLGKGVTCNGFCGLEGGGTRCHM
jgi:hypothetical protein